MRTYVASNSREIAREFARAGGGDFVSDVAVELTVRVLASMLAIPHSERARVLQWAKISDVESPNLEDGGAAVIALMADLFVYAKGVRAQRRTEPTGDLMSMLANATVDGVEFTEDEFCWFYLMLIMAGTETTRHSLAGSIRSLDENGQWPEFVGIPRPLAVTVVDELLRYVSPVMRMRRTATRDVELGGQHIRAGDKVVVWLNAANRDPVVFDHPHRIELGREHNPHVVFGYGAHFCLGTRLARLQLSCMLGELAETCPELRVVAHRGSDGRAPGVVGDHHVYAAENVAHLALGVVDDAGPVAEDRSARVMWSGRDNQIAWQWYLGSADPAVAVPARRADLAGLPPAWVGVGSVDLFHDESVEYARRLQDAGVPAPDATI